ncbi:drug resistance transporter, EmrB/QacA subfamily [Microlunatus sagamiharensis]|uniref:Drug resistance transporter, EmrB/QacA subfamily n=1 Tax=Microlunatus sagamiharensis TaxID=546874 RepID=A0A1H2LGT0_9ACTN|nr:drug resistance transporter, EmrB/QacA subfamily [Microlunatus sagamiharensis]
MDRLRRVFRLDVASQTRTSVDAEPVITRASVGLRSERGPVLLGVMLSMGLIAIDATILATAVPSVVNDLGGFSQFPWLFSIFLLTQAVTVPIFAKLSDSYGRKPVVLAGIAVFGVASVLCGVAWSMPALIAFRALQGLGAGAIQPTCMTIVGDIYTLQERAKVQGYLASVWAISSVVGPTLGGVFVETLDWRWIFFINIPLAAVAFWMISRRFHEKVERVKHQVDVAGAVLLTLGASLLILGLLEGGVLWSWLTLPGIGVPAAGLVLVVAFGFVERRAAEPILPTWVFRNRLLVSTSIASLAIGAVLIGLTSYVPLYAQNVLGHNALVAGFALAALTLGWPIAASMSGRVYLRIGFRATALLGTLIGLVGVAGLTLLRPTTSIGQVGATCFVIGIGMGFVAAPILVAAQSSVDWSVRGVVTGTSMFARSMGSALGIAVFGAIANAGLGTTVGTHASTASSIAPAVMAAALQNVFLASVVGAAVMLVAVLCMPRRVTTVA